MRGVPARRVEIQEGRRLATTRRNLHKSTVDCGKDDLVVACPKASDQQGWQIAQGQRRAADGLDLLELAVGLEHNPTAVRRPERKTDDTIGPLHKPRFEVFERPDPQLTDISRASCDEGQLASVG